MELFEAGGCALFGLICWSSPYCLELRHKDEREERGGKQDGKRRKKRRKRERKGDRHTEKLCKYVDIEDMKVRRAQNNFNYKVP